GIPHPQHRDPQLRMETSPPGIHDLLRGPDPNPMKPATITYTDDRTLPLLKAPCCLTSQALALVLRMGVGRGRVRRHGLVVLPCRGTRPGGLVIRWWCRSPAGW